MLEDISAVGVSHENAPVEVREQFAISGAGSTALSEKAKAMGVENLLVISTCNRTELYASGICVAGLRSLLCGRKESNDNLFEVYGYEKSGLEAVNHLFRVSAGLESQILGDFEIISQVRRAIDHAKSMGMLNGEFDRVLQHVIKGGKRIRSETNLCEGAASVAFAAIQYIKRHVSEIKEKRILLYGAGEIGAITCENLLNQTDGKHITVINRTRARADKLALKYDVTVREQSELKKSIFEADIIIVATGAESYSINAEHFDGIETNKLVLDLSVPRNVESIISNNKLVHLAHIDHLREMQEAAIKRRKASIPEAESIIYETIDELKEWMRMRFLAPSFSAIKESLDEIKQREFGKVTEILEEKHANEVRKAADKLVNKIAKQMISYIKDNQGVSHEPLKTVQNILKIKS